ncbi:MAG: M20/M25/M40 family metallo-hydrolase [Pirellulaceae bacterium]
MGDSKRSRKIWQCIAVACLTLGTASQAFGQAKVSREGALERFTADLKYLASDELAGRLPGTPEMEECVRFIVNDFEKSGLTPAMEDGTYLQTFDVGRRQTVKSEGTSLVFNGPKDKSFTGKLDENFSVQLKNDDFDISGELVFVGYGINAAEHNFNEYANVDVAGKVVVMLRMEPQQEKADSVFDGNETSQYASIRSKVATAVEAGAKAIILVNDSVSAPNDEADELAAADMFGTSTGSVPFFHIKRTLMNELLAAAPLTKPDGSKFGNISDIESYIDENLESVSAAMTGWSVSAKGTFDRESIMTSNIIGVIEGEGDHANETIIIGGHYDHLGFGAFGSRAAGRREIHNGADDNATGTAGIMELVRRFQSRGVKPKRRLVFICFTAEEMGLLGAAHYVNNPVFPLEDTVAMVNYDMIGWLRDNQLTIYSWDSAPEFEGALDRANDGMGMELVKPRGGFAGSDHLPFQQRSIPVMFLHTGLTSTYHTPEDDFETIDCEGAVRVIDYTENLIDELANLESRPTFAQAAPRRPGGSRVRLGVVLETVEDTGAKVVSVTDDSLAAKSGLKADDVIISIGDEEIKERRDVISAVRSMTGKKVTFVVMRGTEKVSVEIELKAE